MNEHHAQINGAEKREQTLPLDAHSLESQQCGSQQGKKIRGTFLLPGELLDELRRFVLGTAIASPHRRAGARRRVATIAGRTQCGNAVH